MSCSTATIQNIPVQLDDKWVVESSPHPCNPDTSGFLLGQCRQWESTRIFPGVGFHRVLFSVGEYCAKSSGTAAPTGTAALCGGVS